jgi:hypothetical protein
VRGNETVKKTTSNFQDLFSLLWFPFGSLLRTSIRTRSALQSTYELREVKIDHHTLTTFFQPNEESKTKTSKQNGSPCIPFQYPKPTHTHGIHPKRGFLLQQLLCYFDKLVRIRHFLKVVSLRKKSACRDVGPWILDP